VRWLEDLLIMSSILVNRAPVLTLWAAVVAERLGHPADTALTLGRAVAGSAARVKARSIGREERKADRDADTPRLRLEHVMAPVFLLGKEIRLLPNASRSHLRAKCRTGDRPLRLRAEEWLGRRRPDVIVRRGAAAPRLGGAMRGCWQGRKAAPLVRRSL
jgi:hypothetical protein